LISILFLVAKEQIICLKNIGYQKMQNHWIYILVTLRFDILTFLLNTSAITLLCTSGFLKLILIQMCLKNFSILNLFSYLNKSLFNCWSFAKLLLDIMDFY
jgi:hypothetical protein